MHMDIWHAACEAYEAEEITLEKLWYVATVVFKEPTTIIEVMQVV